MSRRYSSRRQQVEMYVKAIEKGSGRVDRSCTVPRTYRKYDDNEKRRLCSSGASSTGSGATRAQLITADPGKTCPTSSLPRPGRLERGDRICQRTSAGAMFLSGSFRRGWIGFGGLAYVTLRYSRTRVRASTGTRFLSLSLHETGTAVQGPESSTRGPVSEEGSRNGLDWTGQSLAAMRCPGSGLNLRKLQSNFRRRRSAFGFIRRVARVGFVRYVRYVHTGPRQGLGRADSQQVNCRSCQLSCTEVLPSVRTYGTYSPPPPYV